jgi:DNA-binding LytR/AlgR family response regulator
MTFVCPIVPLNLRVIVSVKFDQRASPAEIAAFKNAVIACPLILHSVELTGAFDFMVEAAVPDMAAYDQRIKSIAQPLASLVSRFEASFVCKRYVRKDEAVQPIWVACDDGLRRVDIGSIDKVTAEGDYMRVHSRGDSWMVHATMRSFVDRLASEDFLKLHRSTLVRCGFIERMYRESGHWVAMLDDGSCERVAKSQVLETLERLRVDSTTTEVIPSNKPGLVDVGHLN